MNTQQFESYKAFLNTLDIDNVDLPYFANEDHASADDLYNAIEDGNGFDVEIIYYSRAIDYLKENDESLRESLSLAHEMGYTPENLNSEILASLLASQKARKDFEALRSEIDDFFSSLEETEDEE